MLFGPPAGLRSDRLDRHSDSVSSIPSSRSSKLRRLSILHLIPPFAATYISLISQLLSPMKSTLTFPLRRFHRSKRPLSRTCKQCVFAFRCRKGPWRRVNGVDWLVEEKKAGRRRLFVLIPLCSCCLSSVSHFLHFSFLSCPHTQDLAP